MTINQYKYDLPNVIAQAEAALANSTAAPRLFQRGHLLVSIQAAEPRPRARIVRAPGAPIIRVCPSSTLRLCLAKAATWTVPDKRSKSLEETMPQPWVVETLLELDEWPHVPVLTGLVTAPTLRPDGTVLETKGYDETTGLFYDPGTTEFFEVPRAPTRDDALKALEVLRGPFRDFPFQAPHHRSAALAALLTVLIRHAIPGNVPLFGVNAPTAGTGKTLLVDVIALIASGRPAPKVSQPTKEEEWGKQLLTCALEGDQMVLIDNCMGTLASGELCKALTAEALRGRILGVHKNGEAPQDAVYFATGNSLRFKSDITRRVIPIDLESPLERPETRTGFAIPAPLPAWTLAHRPALVQAALTIVRAYHLASDHPAVPTWGSFEAWREKVCGPLLWLGLPDPLDGVEAIREDDEERDQLRTLLLTWDTVYQEKPTTLRTVKDDLALYTSDSAPGTRSSYHDLEDALRPFDATGRPFLNLDSVGKHLKKVAGRIVCGKTITRGKTRGSAGFPWSVLTKNPCSCVGCVGNQHTTREKGKETVNGVGSQKPTPPTLAEQQNAVSGKHSNGLQASVGAQTTYTDTSPECRHIRVDATMTCKDCGVSLYRRGSEKFHH